MKRLYNIILVNIILISSLIFFFNLTTCKADGNTIYVDDDIGKNFTSIQEAIDFVSDGDTIFVFDGIYFENIVINKMIILKGENKNDTIINGNLSGNTVHIIADNVTVTNFSILNSGNIFPNAGINLSSNNNIINGNILKNNFYGITIYNVKSNIIFDNIISNNDHCGIYLSGSINNIIFNNTIKFHQFNGIGMYNSTNNNVIMENNLINNDFCGINLRISSDNNITMNLFKDNNIGIHVPPEKYLNHVSDNVFLNNRIDVEIGSAFPVFELIIAIIIFSLLTLFIIFWREKSQKKSRAIKGEKHVLDTQGKACPIPLIMTKKKIAKMNKGETLEIITSDVVAKENIERFGREKHELLSIEQKDEIFKLSIKK